jgi:hypothetical protein
VKQRLYTQPTIILLLNLAITDLILLVLQCPMMIVVGLRGEYIYGSSDRIRCMVCKTGVVLLISILNSTFTITLMSIDRFLFIYKPLRYKLYVTKWRTAAVTVTAWFIAAAISAIPFTKFGDFVYSRVIACALDVNLENSYYPILILITIFVAAVPVIVCNLWICCIVQRNIRAIYKVKSSLKTTEEYVEFRKNLKKKQHKKERHLCKVFSIMLCSNISWIPLSVMILLALLKMTEIEDLGSALLFFILSQVTLHPIIEAMLIKEVRLPLKNFLLCCCKSIKTKMISSRNLACSNDDLNSSRNPYTEATELSKDKCAVRDFIEICGAAGIDQSNIETSSEA